MSRRCGEFQKKKNLKFFSLQLLTSRAPVNPTPATVLAEIVITGDYECNDNLLSSCVGQWAADNNNLLLQEARASVKVNPENAKMIENDIFKIFFFFYDFLFIQTN